jgi:biotin carboxyl carrier protein
MADIVYRVTLDERVLQVRVRHAADHLEVQVDDGPERTIELGAVNGPLYWLGVGDNRREVLAQVKDGRVSVVIDGITYDAEVVDEARARLVSVVGGRGSAHAHPLKAPMPGLVVKLLCEVGDIVEPGQPLVVLQAMKMENELSLPRGGTVTEINAIPGATVEQGTILVVVE